MTTILGCHLSRSVGHFVPHSSALGRVVSAVEDTQLSVYLCYYSTHPAVLVMIMSLEMKRDALSIAIKVLLPGILL